MTITNTDRAQTCNVLLRVMEDIEQGLAELGDLLRGSGTLGAKVFELPSVALENEDEPEGPIEVNEFRGSEAFDRAIGAWSRFYAEPKASTRLVYRMPGVVYVTGRAANDIASQVDQINLLKEQFGELVEKLGDRDDRFEWVHRTFPGLITLQVTRKLHCMRGIRTVSFSWAHREAIYKKSKADVLEMLERTNGRARPSPDDQPWHMHVDRAMGIVHSLPDNVELRQRRRGRVHPVINMRTDEVPAKRVQRPAALPTIILEPAERIKVGTLRNYEPPSEDAALRQDRRKTKEEPLIDFLNIYEIK